jgi:HSP20 family protein
MHKNIDYLLARGPMVVLDNINKIQNKVVKVIDDTLNIDLKKFCVLTDIMPAADFYEKDNNYIIDIDLPGVDIKHADINLHGDKLTVSGERKGTVKPKKAVEVEESAAEETEDDGITYFEQDISYGSFQRVFIMPSEVDDSRIKATYKNGVLTIKVPKAKESKLKKIKIEI